MGDSFLSGIFVLNREDDVKGGGQSVAGMPRLPVVVINRLLTTPIRPCPNNGVRSAETGGPMANYHMLKRNRIRPSTSPLATSTFLLGMRVMNGRSRLAMASFACASPNA
jgi:hypothetical protein